MGFNLSLFPGVKAGVMPGRFALALLLSLALSPPAWSAVAADEITLATVPGSVYKLRDPGRAVRLAEGCREGRFVIANHVDGAGEPVFPRAGGDEVVQTVRHGF